MPWASLIRVFWLGLQGHVTIIGFFSRVLEMELTPQPLLQLTVSSLLKFAGPLWTAALKTQMTTAPAGHSYETGSHMCRPKPLVQKGILGDMYIVLNGSPLIFICSPRICGPNENLR